MDRLEGTVLPSAFHNSSSTGYDAPKCAPNTRVSVLQEIWAWLDDTDDDVNILAAESAEGGGGTPRTMWIRGAAGSGKTAIARSLAVMCSEQGRLSGSFFFSRSRAPSAMGGQGRRDEDSIVATLAYQMIMNIPEAEHDILLATTRNRFLFTLSIKDQLEKLILTPLLQQSLVMQSPEKPSLFIIDGLDEAQSPNAGVTIVQEFVKAMKSTTHNLPHKLLILSRPEQNIARTMGEVRELGLTSINLDERQEAHDDIRNYLVESFNRICRAHPLGREDMIPKGWPARKDITMLVHRASSQFVYAATVIKYIGNDRADPVERLQVIVDLKRDLKNRPYADLDDLFTQILSSVPVESIHLVLLIFRIVLMQYIPPKVDSHTGFNSKITFIHELLGLTRTEVILILKDLPSIVITTSTDVYFLHASIVGFLLDPTRSLGFHINAEGICLDLVQRCLDGIIKLNKTQFKDELTWTDPTVQTINRYLAGVRHFQKSVVGARTVLFSILCQWDLTEALYLVSTSKARAYTEFQFSLLLEWIVAEYQNLMASSTSSSLNALRGVIMVLKSWWISQARKFAFRDDLICIFDHHNQRNLDHVSSTLHQKEVTLWLYLTTDIKKDSVLHQFFCDVDEFEKDCMDSGKYAILAFYCCQYLFSNFCHPINTINEQSKNSRQNHFEDIMLRARRALHYSESRTDLASFFEISLRIRVHPGIDPVNLERRIQGFLQARYTDIKFLHWIRSLARAILDYVMKARRIAS